MNACCHCELPVGLLGGQREVLGELRWFCCYGCCLAWQVERGSADAPEAARQLIRLGVGGFLAMNVMLLSWLLYAGSFRADDAWLLVPVLVLLWLLSIPLLVLLGGPFIAGAWRSLREGRPNADTLVAVGVLAAFAYSSVQVLRGSDQVYFDTAGMVLMLFTLGRYLEAQGRARAARSLAPMLAAERATARRLIGDDEDVVAARDLRPGDRVRVLPGECIAVDGVVVAGSSDCDESALTGQPAPQTKGIGSFVTAGCVNGHGALVVRATVAGDDTRWMHIGRTVRAALAAKSLRSVAIDRASAVFVPAVLLLAVATAAFWAHRGSSSGDALFAALAVLVVACPCSLGLAASLAATLAIAQAARRGILVRSAAALETLAAVRGVAFDKTGTLTDATLQPRAASFCGSSPDEALRRGGGLARGNDHPLARALVVLAGEGAAAPTHVDAQRAHPGGGLTGTVDGETCAIGSVAFMTSRGFVVPAALAEGADAEVAQVLVGWQGQARARFAFAAPLSADAADVVAACREHGLQTLLLSGDAAPAVAAAAARLGVDAGHAGQTPEAKVRVLRDWRARLRGPVAMLGDGLNDGPVLAAAGVGMAVGSAAHGASELARASADIVLPPGGLRELPWLIALAAQLRRSVRTNLAWAFGYNAVALTLAASGLLQPVIAAALMAGSTLVVATRSWRASRREVCVPAPATATTATVRARLLRWSLR